MLMDNPLKFKSSYFFFFSESDLIIKAEFDSKAQLRQSSQKVKRNAKVREFHATSSGRNANIDFVDFKLAAEEINFLDAETRERRRACLHEFYAEQEKLYVSFINTGF
jgi:hypothetical protein